ncbi:MAG: excinuclease ABC subunit UvrC [Candidatus Heimdallarchaeaceae archaeon]
MNIVSDIERLPTGPGVYLIKDSEGNVIYIGKAKNLKDRVKQHFSETSSEIKKERAIQEQAYNIDFLETRTETEAILLERRLIKDIKPKLNVRSKDDKSSLLIRISKEEPFPQLYVVRETDPHVEGSIYFGPYGYDRKLRDTVKLVLKLFPIANCGEKLYKYREKKSVNRCMRKRIGQCIACDKSVSPEKYNQIVENVINFLEGNVGALLDSLEKEMWEEGKKENFERAAVLRDLINSVRKIVSIQKENNFNVDDIVVIATREEQEVLSFCKIEIKNKRINRIISDSIVLETKSENFTLSNLLSLIGTNPSEIDHLVVDEVFIKKIQNDLKVKLITPDSKILKDVFTIAKRNAFNELARYFSSKTREKNIKKVLEDMKVILKLPKLPIIIHGYDISTLGGKHSTGSCVVFKNGKPEKRYYKQFKIRQEYSDPNDYAMMREVLRRHYSNYNDFDEPQPDLILLDGGKGQLNVAVKVLKELKLDLPLVSIAKKEEELFVPWDTNPVVLPRESEVLKLLQQIRDEAHRFAIQYSKQLRTRKLGRSTFEKIKGIGPKKAVLLNTYFDNLQDIGSASVAEIMKLIKVDEQTAVQVLNLAKNLTNSVSFE